MKKVSLSLLVFFFIGILAVQAQPPGMPDAPSQAPIDGGLSVLAIAGGMYALKKMKSKK